MIALARRSIAVPTRAVPVPSAPSVLSHCSMTASIGVSKMSKMARMTSQAASILVAFLSELDRAKLSAASFFCCSKKDCTNSAISPTERSHSQTVKVRCNSRSFFSRMFLNPVSTASSIPLWPARSSSGARCDVRSISVSSVTECNGMTFDRRYAPLSTPIANRASRTRLSELVVLIFLSFVDTCAPSSPPIDDFADAPI